MANGKWKKVLIPSLGSRHREQSFNNRSGLSASNTAVEFSTTRVTNGTTTDTNAPLATDEEIDNRVISALLDTTAESESRESRGMFSSLTSRSQPKLATRSHTLNALHSNKSYTSAGSPSKAHDFSTPHIPIEPDRSTEHNLLPSARTSATDLLDQSGNGLIRPLTRSQTASSPFGARPARRMLQSSSSSALTSTTRYKGGSPIRKARSGADNLSHSVTSVLQSTANANNSGSRSKLTRPKTKNVFAKVAGVISDRFNTKGNRKEDKGYNAINESVSVGDVKPAQIIDGLPLPRLVLASLPLTNQAPSSSRHISMSESMNLEMDKAARITGRAGRYGRAPAVSRKRLTIVDEATFPEDGPSDGLFYDAASTHSSAGTDEDLNNGREKALQSTDPFEAERLLDANTDGILNTPPVGFSTPRRRSRTSWIRCSTPTRGSKAPLFDSSDLIEFSDAGSPVKSERHRKISTIHGSPLRKPMLKETTGTDDSQHEGRGFYDGGRESSDSTRLSSYPPGSTIRHVPRSMGRLMEVPVLSAPFAQDNETFPIARKKHPSPSKVQLELYGNFMENNLALGVFQDPDELGLSFETPYTSPGMLSPRDTNCVMRGNGTSTSNIDVQKDFVGLGSRIISLDTRSRIPQPVKKVSRARTETTLAKNLYPVNAGDMSTEDELQWDSSAHTFGHRCNHCGSMNKL